MDRPKRNDDYVIKAAALDLVDELMAWANAKEPERAEYREVAEGVMKEASFHNGYELARNLERKGFEPDARLVEILDEASHLLYVAHDRGLKEWVKGWNIKVPFTLGQSVTIKHKGRVVSGSIAKLYAETAVCVVFCPELGHVERGFGSSGLVVNSEDVQAAEDAVSATTNKHAPECLSISDVEQHGQASLQNDLIV